MHIYWQLFVCKYVLWSLARVVHPPNRHVGSANFLNVALISERNKFVKMNKFEGAVDGIDGLSWRRVFPSLFEPESEWLSSGGPVSNVEVSFVMTKSVYFPFVMSKFGCR